MEKHFVDLMKDVKVGDIVRIISGGKTYDANVLNVMPNQIGVEMAGEKYLIVPNSLDGDELESYRVSGGNRYKATTRDITKISLIRNGSVINSITPTKKQTPSPSGNQGGNSNRGVILPFFKDAYNSITGELKRVNENSKILIKTGTLSTNNSINPSTITEIELSVVKMFKNSIAKVLVREINGPDTSLENIKNTYLRINLTNCVLIDQKGIKILLKTMEKPYTKVLIENVFDVEVSEYPKADTRVTLDDLMGNKNFRDLYNKEPSLFGKLLGQGPVGIHQINKLLDKYGVSRSFNTKNNKVKFEYVGKQIDTGIGIVLTSGQQYVGRYINSREIRLINPSKRNVTVTLKLDEKVRTNTYTVNIFKNSIVNARHVSDKIGDGIIRILDNNFK